MVGTPRDVQPLAVLMESDSAPEHFIPSVLVALSLPLPVHDRNSYDQEQQGSAGEHDRISCQNNSKMSHVPPVGIEPTSAH